MKGYEKGSIKTKSMMEYQELVPEIVFIKRIINPGYIKNRSK
jgi:hypothetical protein